MFVIGPLGGGAVGGSVTALITFVCPKRTGGRGGGKGAGFSGSRVEQPVVKITTTVLASASNHSNATNVVAIAAFSVMRSQCEQMMFQFVPSDCTQSELWAESATVVLPSIVCEPVVAMVTVATPTFLMICVRYLHELVLSSSVMVVV